MRPRSLVLLAVSIIAVAACATTTPLKEPGTGGGNPGASSSAGGAGGDLTGTGGAGGDSTGTGGSIEPCGESPCKLTGPQCGCKTGEQCSTDVNSPDPSYRVCVPAGIEGEGQKCANGAGCGPGLVCIQKSDMLSTCATYCASDADCQTPGGLCILTLGDGKGGVIPNATMCTENCDPTGSADCTSGLACRIGTETMGQQRSYTRCLAAGGGTQKTPCSVNADCGAGYGCFNSGPNSHICGHYCKVGGNDCPAGSTCTALQANGKDVAIGGITYGACL